MRGREVEQNEVKERQNARTGCWRADPRGQGHIIIPREDKEPLGTEESGEESGGAFCSRNGENGRFSSESRRDPRR